MRRSQKWDHAFDQWRLQGIRRCVVVHAEPDKRKRTDVLQRYESLS
jgi:hypothetical protein